MVVIWMLVEIKYNFIKYLESGDLMIKLDIYYEKIYD